MSKYQPKKNTAAVVTSVVLMIVALIVVVVGAFFGMQINDDLARFTFMSLLVTAAPALVGIAYFVGE